MKSLSLFLLIIISVLLNGCYGDKVVDDLIEYKQLVQTRGAQLQDKMRVVDNKMKASRSSSDTTHTLEEMRSVLRDMSQMYQDYSPKTEEVEGIREKINQQFDVVLISLDNLVEALNKDQLSNLPELQSTFIKNYQELLEVENQLMNLAKVKEVDLSQ